MLRRYLKTFLSAKVRKRSPVKGFRVKQIKGISILKKS